MFGYVGLVQNKGAWAVRAGKASCRLVGVASLGCALRARVWLFLFGFLHVGDAGF